MLGMIGIIVSLCLLMYLAYRGITVLILAPVLALVAVLFSGDIPLMAGYTEIFMKGFAGFAKLYFPLFLLGAIFGKVMDEIGAAKSIAQFISKKLGAKKAILSVVLSCAILTYGGVSLFVVAFAVYPIAAALFREAGIPKRFIPAALALGSFTFTMTALPGTPQIQNAIPMSYFGTNSFAAPLLGIAGAAVMFGCGVTWLKVRTLKAMSLGEGYGDHPNENIKVISEDKIPSPFVALLPIIIVLIVNFWLSFMVFANLEAPYLVEMYGTSIDKVKGSWALIIALVVAILFAIIMNRKNIDDIKSVVNDGAMGSLLAIMNTSSEVGYGTVIKSLGAFAMIKALILAIPGNPLISLAVSTSTLAGITGSASGGMSIALSALGETYMQKAQVLGINPEAFHRIAAMACGGLDTLPHNGAVITLLAVTQLTHKDSYLDIGMCTVVFPLLATVVAIILATFGVV